MKKTGWFSDATVPVRDGLYETRVGGCLTWSVWKDEEWHYACNDAEEAVSRAARGYVSFWQTREWRGLTEPAA